MINISTFYVKLEPRDSKLSFTERQQEIASLTNKEGIT